MNFLERAAPYAAMGIPVFPLLPNEKRPPASMTDWPDLATTDPAQIAGWNAENPNYNCGLVAKAEGVLILEFDVQRGMQLAAEEMGQTVPATRVHISGKGFGHYVFLQTNRSRALGNRQANKPEGGEWFSFRQNNRYVVGPGSIHPNGNEYGVAHDVAPIPVPEWVCDFVEKYSQTKTETKDARPVAEDFDFDDLMEHYGIDIVNIDGEWHIPDVCPVAGYRHENSVATGFYWDGQSIGFNCFAQGCEGSSMSIGQLLRHLNQDHKPYPKPIWEEEDLDMSQFEGELEDAPTAPVALTDVFTAAREQCQRGPGEGCQCGGDHKYPQSNVSAEARAVLEEIAETVEKSAPAVLAASELAPDEMELAKGMSNERIMTLITQRADTVKIEKLEWLWTDRIPAGKITLLVGKPDCGKSLAMLNIIARVTTGEDWPDGVKNSNGPKEVVLGATEDDLGTTLVPRLKAAGADLERVHLVKRVIVEGKKTVKRMLQLKEDALLIKRMLRDHPGVALIALDPISGYFGDADPNKDKDIRPVLEAIQNACEKSHASLIGIVHHNKRGDADALGKVLGGSAVVGVSRAVWQFSRDSANKEEFHMALAKGNLAKKRTGMKYKIAESEIQLADGTKTGVPHTEWLGETDLDANEVLDQERENAKNGGGESVTKQGAARLLINSELANGAKLTRDIYKKAEAEDISISTMKNAARQMNIQITQVDRYGYYWALPGTPPVPSADKKPPEPQTVDPKAVQAWQAKIADPEVM